LKASCTKFMKTASNLLFASFFLFSFFWEAFSIVIYHFLNP